MKPPPHGDTGNLGRLNRGSDPEGVLNLQAVIAERRQKNRAVPRAFVQAVIANDVEALSSTLNDLGSVFDGWKRALRLCASLTNVRPETKEWFLRAWCRGGDDLRDNVSGDLVLTAGLRALLPPYTGTGMTLFRGDSAFNRRRRTYGLSWSASEDVADGFAQGMWRSFQGGSVLLRSEVPPEAILCCPLMHRDDEYGEEEYLIDSRLLRSVTVLRRYPQTSFVRGDVSGAGAPTATP